MIRDIEDIWDVLLILGLGFFFVCLCTMASGCKSDGMLPVAKVKVDSGELRDVDSDVSLAIGHLESEAIQTDGVKSAIINLKPVQPHLVSHRAWDIETWASAQLNKANLEQANLTIKAKNQYIDSLSTELDTVIVPNRVIRWIRNFILLIVVGYLIIGFCYGLYEYHWTWMTAVSVVLWLPIKLAKSFVPVKK